jgi:VCBS repeat-containing protein
MKHTMPSTNNSYSTSITNIEESVTSTALITEDRSRYSANGKPNITDIDSESSFFTQSDDQFSIGKNEEEKHHENNNSHHDDEHDGSEHNHGGTLNHAPTVLAPLISTAFEGAAPYSLNLLDGASDLDRGDTLGVTGVTYSVDGGLASGTAPAGIILIGSILTVDPANSAYDHLAVGEYSTIIASYTLSDGKGGTVLQTQTVTINGTNDAPTFAPGTPESVNIFEHHTAITTVQATDPDHNDTLSYSILNTNNTDFAHFAIDSNGVLTFTSAPDFENPLDIGGLLHDNAYLVDVLVTDTHGITATHTLTVQVQNIDELPLPYNLTSDPNDFDDLQPSFAHSGTTGNDTLVGTPVYSTIVGLAGNDLIYGYTGSYALYGQAGNDTVYNYFADLIFGGSGNDTIYNQNSVATIYGGSGNDTIYGTVSSQDTIYGGYGADTLYGRGGTSTFGFLDVRDTGDVIYNFAIANNKLDFSAINADPLNSADQAFTLANSSNVVAHGINYFDDGAGNTKVWADTDGDTATVELEITLAGIAASSLTVDNFTL